MQSVNHATFHKNSIKENPFKNLTFTVDKLFYINKHKEKNLYLFCTKTSNIQTKKQFNIIIMSTSKVVLGTVAGLAIGGILGILFAPDKGSVTRKQIMDKGSDYADDLKSKYNEIADSISEKLQNAKEFAQELTEDTKAEFDEAKKNTNHIVSNY